MKPRLKLAQIIWPFVFSPNKKCTDWTVTRHRSKAQLPVILWLFPLQCVSVILTPKARWLKQAPVPHTNMIKSKRKRWNLFLQCHLTIFKNIRILPVPQQNLLQVLLDHKGVTFLFLNKINGKENGITGSFLPVVVLHSPMGFWKSTEVCLVVYSDWEAPLAMSGIVAHNK